MQAEDGDFGKRSDRPPAVATAKGAGGVIEKTQTVASGQSGHGVDAAGQAELVDRHQRSRAPGDLPRDVLGVEIEGGGIDLGEYRRRAAMTHDIDRGDEGQRRNDDLIAGPDPPGMQDEEGTRGPARHANRMAGAAGSSEAPFELDEARAADDPAAGDHGGGRLRFLAAEVRPAERDRIAGFARAR